jgi:hypothetical protein
MPGLTHFLGGMLDNENTDFKSYLAKHFFVLASPSERLDFQLYGLNCIFLIVLCLCHNSRDHRKFLCLETESLQGY